MPVSRGGGGHGSPKNRETDTASLSHVQGTWPNFGPSANKIN